MLGFDSSRWRSMETVVQPANRKKKPAKKRIRDARSGNARAVPCAEETDHEWGTGCEPQNTADRPVAKSFVLSAFMARHAG
jgi:hypothetical protein